MTPRACPDGEIHPYHHLQASGDSLSAEHGSGSKRIGAINAMTYGITLAVTGQAQGLLYPQGL